MGVPRNHPFQFSIEFSIVNHLSWGTSILGNFQMKKNEPSASGEKTLRSNPFRLSIPFQYTQYTFRHLFATHWWLWHFHGAKKTGCCFGTSFFSHSVGNFIVPTDFHIFQMGGSTTNQKKRTSQPHDLPETTTAWQRSQHVAAKRSCAESSGVEGLVAKRYPTIVCWWMFIPQTGWWFGRVFIFPYIGHSNPNWLSWISGRLKTTNH